MSKTPEERQLAIRETSDKMEAVVSECGVTALAQLPPLVQAIQLASGIARMREVLTEPVVKKYFMPLQGTPLGFVTDKDAKGDSYPWEVVRDVVTEGLLRGFRPIGNELNIIAGRFYGAKAGFERIVQGYPGVREVQYQLGVPEAGPGGTSLVAFDASWSYDGTDMVIAGRKAEGSGFDTRIPVRVNAGMGPDAVLGKATRKLFARIYQRLTGCSADVVELEPGDYQDNGVPAPKVEGKRLSLRKPAPVEREPGEEG